MEVKLEPTWKEWLNGEFSKPYFSKLTAFVKSEFATQQCFPPGNKIFSAFDLCSPDSLKVVILGQDPYHGPGQANGLCFSVNDGVPMPPSLKNIFKEIHQDLGLQIPTNGNLERWARQGVLLLNATLTVRAHNAGSHQKQGWEEFTDQVISNINQRKEGIVFMLWGNFAQQKGALIDRNRHFVLTSAHPSPFSATRFFGNHHFSRCNSYLESKGLESIQW